MDSAARGMSNSQIYDKSLANVNHIDSIESKDLQPWYKEHYSDSGNLDDDLLGSQRNDGIPDTSEIKNKENESDNLTIQNETQEKGSDFIEVGKAGGRYQDLKNEYWEKGSVSPVEVHHMPADSSSHLERCDGPAIVMDYNDHRETASCGASREAWEYRAKQKELIDQGKFREAFQMDVDDLHEKFGNKYDEAISKAEKYIDQLEQENKI